MDISSLLPLLMKQNGGGGETPAALMQALATMNGGAGAGGGNPMAAMAQALSAMNGMGGTNGAGGAGNLASVLSAMNGGQNPSQGGPAPAQVLSMLANNGAGQNQSMNLINLLSTLGSNRAKQKRPTGLKPVKAFIPNEIMGKLVKFFNT